MPGICECCAAKTKDLGHELAGAQGASPQSPVPSQAEQSRASHVTAANVLQTNEIGSKTRSTGFNTK